MKKLFIALAILTQAFIGGNLMAQNLTADDYCNLKKASPKSVKEMRPMADGVSYTAISDDGKSIDIFSYKTGKKTGTLFSVNEILGEVKIQEFNGYTLSDNGKFLLLWNDKEQVYRHSFFAEYYVYDMTRRTMKRVSTQGKQRAATMSHDGRMVAYQRGNNLWISHLDYGTDQAITSDGKINEIINGTPDWAYEEEFGILNTIRWSADDNLLAYIRFDESKVPVYSFDNYRSYCMENPLSDPYPEAFSYKYPLPGYENSEVSVRVYDLNVRNTKVMDIPISHTDYVPVMEFTEGSSDRMVVGVLNRNQNELRLYAVNPGSTVSRLMYTDSSDAWLSPNTYQMCSFGKQDFVIASERTGYRHLYQYDYSGGELRRITSGNFNVTDFYGIDRASGSCYFQCTVNGAPNRNVAKVDKTGKLTVLNNVEGWESASFNNNFEYYIRRWSNAVTPWQYTLCSTRGGKIAELEMNSAYASQYSGIAHKELLKVPNGAGGEMDAYLIKPANFDAGKRYPLMMYQYNGPESQEVKNCWALDGLYYIAQQGYIVGCVDGRGTGNRERSWATSVYKQLGNLETADQIAGARYFGTLPYVDENRLSCFGWSYGGYMTLMELTDASNPFKCGVSMAPVTDWRFYDSIYTERFMLTPQQNEAGYDKASALNRTSHLKGRLLIMHGTSDDNVHFYNTLKFTSKLNYEGKVFDMLALTGFEHSLRMCNARTMLYTRIVDFLDINLK